MQVGQNVALGLDGCGGPGEACSGLRIDPIAVVYEISLESGFFDLIVSKTACELVDDGAHHLKVSKLLGAYLRSDFAPA